MLDALSLRLVIVLSQPLFSFMNNLPEFPILKSLFRTDRSPGQSNAASRSIGRFSGENHHPHYFADYFAAYIAVLCVGFGINV